ncbi:MAG: LysR family transcriptional regulator [Termitinemataceae bacterium]|nr:MAG: LysR family transcriptional regulator [Termitinemataceae bacterium]
MKTKAVPVVKVFLAYPGGRGEPFCGPGMVKLLQKIEETGNVRQACENMKMSYSKGWKLLKALETYLEYPAVKRRQGGKDGGAANLTEAGAAFLKKQTSFESDCEYAIKKIFEKYYD